jgi:hypothetical protein
MMAIAFLGAVVTAFVFAGRTIYYAFHDAFVVPAILSPDSDTVIASKLKLGELDVERARAGAELEGVEADLAASAKAIERLEGLRQIVALGVEWTARVTSQRASSGASQLSALAQQKTLLRDMLAKQNALADKARADAEAGVISRTDYAKEAQAVSQLELALLENERGLAEATATMAETSLAQRALTHRAESAPTPEMMIREEQTIRIELEVTRLESERRSKLAQKAALVDRIAKLDAFASELRGKPVYQAAERAMHVAFVPYTQMEGVERGATVYSCVWGLVFCKAVGSVSDMVPGEVALTDPWGGHARGQYAVLSLTDPDAARAQTLRVRKSGAAVAAPPVEEPRVSSR